jgi:hypothetical protein
MLKQINRTMLVASATFSVTALASSAAYANNFNSIAGNMVNSIASFPTLISAISYLFGMLLLVLGIMKIKDHVENPTQEPIKNGAIRLAAGGALFALPIISEAALSTIGTGTAVGQASLSAMSF